MNQEEILHECQVSGALLEGHFLLRSGLHSNRFFQAALVLQYPQIAEKLCVQLADSWQNKNIETVISPAVGGLIVGQELARALGVRAIFADKDDGEMVLKRGFSIKPGENILIGEDVVTRGGRVQQTIELVREHGGNVVGVAVIVDRSVGKAAFDVSFTSLIELELATYEADSCPLCASGVPLVRPGSK